MGSEAENLDDKRIALNKQVEEAMAKSVSKLFHNLFAEEVEIGSTVYNQCPSSDLSGITGLKQKRCSRNIKDWIFRSRFI